jgi:hypothetical protein
MPEPLQDRLRLYLPRTPSAMREAAARLDRAALSIGRREVSRRIFAAVVADMTGTEQLDDISSPENQPASHMPSLLV